jgi:hypothetical protein
MAKEEPEWWFGQLQWNQPTNESIEPQRAKINSATMAILYSRHWKTPWKWWVLYINNERANEEWKWVVCLKKYIWKTIKLCMQNGRPLTIKIEEWFQLSMQNK